jgi:multiple sugar transport system ATP-binding protein
LASIRLENVTLRYGGKNVLDDINLSVTDKELCSLVGPSGCGKSLVLRIIAGLVKPTRGTVYFDDRPVNSVPAGDRDIAMVFQRFALYPYMTVRENWAFPLRAARLSHLEIEGRIRAMSESLQMDVLLDRRPTQLSGGQQQRAALGRALVRRPRLFLWDEPLGAQDAKRRVELRTDLKKLQMELGITTVCVTSDQFEAQALGDRVAVMDTGTLQQVGTPEEVYEMPVNLFVAGFIGSPPMNLIEGKLQRKDGQLYVTHPQFQMCLPPALASGAEAGTRNGAVVVGIRPEHIRVSTRELPEAIRARLFVAEPESNQLLMDFKLGDLTVRTRCDREEMDCEPQVGEEAFLILDQNAMHLFDEASGRRIG